MVVIGSRVFLTPLKMFGEVTRTSTLGTDAVVTQCDDGSLRVVYGGKVDSDVVEKDTSKNKAGEVITIPTDVRIVGDEVLEKFGVDQQTRAALFQKFLLLEESVRLEKASYWELHKNDNDKMATFIPELLVLLEEDTNFIQNKSAKILKRFDTETREKMLTKLMTVTTKEDRTALILQFTSVQNDRYKKQDFVQNMLELLLDNKTYIRYEFKATLEKLNIFEEESTTMIETFLTSSTDSQIEQVVSQWRKLKLYRSAAGGVFARKVLMNPDLASP